MIWVKYIILVLLWTCCNSQNVCEEPPEVDFGEMVSDEKVAYQKSDRVQYRCYPGYALEGPDWITCEGPQWTSPPKCLASCSITRQQLEAKNLLLSGGRRRSHVIGNNQTLEFLCREGYILSAPSVRKCIDGNMDLPSCISERGKKCSRPPSVANGDTITLSQKEYTSGSSVEFRCQRYYAMEGHSRSFCDNGNWTKVPVCLEPCVISLAELERRKMGVKLRSNEDEFQTLYLPHGDSVEFNCKPGHSLATNLSQSAFEIQCRGGPIVYPECKAIKCDPPRLANGTFRPERTVYQDGDLIKIECDHRVQTAETQTIAECTRNGWSPPPQCNAGGNCGHPPSIQNGDVLNPLQAQYAPGTTLQYKCQFLYVMNGNSQVRCENGHWTEAPTCIDATCTISEVDMAQNNIQLKWTNDKKLYSESGDAVEFICKWHYRKDPSSPPFRTQCIEGKVTYPRCI
ncbi:complement factor H-related protein 1-like [Eublepharis macularius]|uniref:Complement factor H-related protein 1-like n=1 Tax=Eublepharis macularius TaxID=481883 RepID=A0AA97JFZ3_EUBMA|nr:complement factor H-related protein 1-like [Eublepharis macularius]